MSYIGIDPKLKAYKDAMFVAVGGETVIPIKCDMETLVVKNGSFLIPRYDYYINRENTINVATAASKGDEYYIVNISTFTFSESITRKEVEDMLDTNARPLFEVIWWPSRTSIPAGLVPADGQELSRGLYMDAFTGIEAGLVPLVADADWLSTLSKRASYTTGNGSTTFRVPDYNGKSQGSTSLFLRGDGNNSGRAGEVQGDGIKTHYSRWFWATKRSNETSYSNIPTTPGGINPVAVQIPNMDIDVDDYNGKGASEYMGGASKSASIISTIYSGENETRPMNTAGVWCVRLFNGTVYAGRANASQLATEVAKLESELQELKGRNKTTLDFQGTWVPYGSGYSQPFVSKQGRVVTIQGLTKNSNLGNTHRIIAQLPKDCWPGETLIFQVMTNGGLIRLDVTYDGHLVVSNSATVPEANRWCTLSGISFAVE